MPPAFQATVTFAPSMGAAGDAAPLRWFEWARLALRPFRTIAEDALDRSTGLYNRSGLFSAAGEALQTRDCEVSMVLLEFSDLREVYTIYGQATARKVVGRVVRRLRTLGGRRGFAGRTGPTQFAVVLPDVAEERAVQMVQRVLGKPARVEFDAGDSEIVLVPDLLVASVEAGERPLPTLYRDMCRELARAQKVELRRLNWLTSERERHSRPMSLMPR